MRQAVLYLRVSHREQVDGHSLDAQARLCADWCGRNGYEVVEVFREEGESAKTANRTQLKRLLAFVRGRQHQVDAVVVKDFSRFARSSHDHHTVKAVLERLGVSVRSVLEPVDDSPFGRFIETVFAGTHQLENELRSERTRTCMVEAMRAGRWLFQVPLGYRWAHVDGDKFIEVDAERAPLVREGFERVAAGDCGPAEALRRANAAGLRTRQHKPVTLQTFTRMLRHPLYMGRVVYSEWGIDVEGAHEAIVESRVWHRTQAVLDGRAPSPASRGHRLDNPDFPLRRFARCGPCDTPLTGEWARGRSQRYAYYRCRNRDCRAVKVPREDLHQQFAAFLRELQPGRAYLTLLREIVRDIWEGDRAAATAQSSRLQRRVDDLQARKDRLVEAFLFERAVDRDTYDRLHRDISAELADTHLRLDDARTELRDVDGLVDYAIAVLTHADQLWLQLEPELQRRFERAVFPSGVTYDPNGTFRTPATSLLFEPYPREWAGESRMVARVEAISNRIRAWINAAEGLEAAGIPQPMAA